MHNFFLFLNEPLVLWTLFSISILLILIDYLFPVDWPAYLGYISFAVFIGATAPLTPYVSLVAMLVVFVVMLILHEFIFARFLTNAPKYENRDQISIDKTEAKRQTKSVDEGHNNDV